MAAPTSEDQFHPGAARFGNFINYYQFNPPQTRLDLLPSSLISDLGLDLDPKRPVLALDVGCNAGNLTLDLYRRLMANHSNSSRILQLYMIGIDVDAVLIERCHEANDLKSHVTFEQLDFMDAASRQKCLQNFLTPFGRDNFDIVFAFSVTMWIHLNHGDSGLTNFLKAVSGLGHYLLLEPQPWKCYRSAQRRMKRLNPSECPSLDNLTFRQNVVQDMDNILTTQCSTRQLKKLGQTSWDRQLVLYENMALR